MPAEIGFWIVVVCWALYLGFVGCFKLYHWWFWRTFDKAAREGRVKYTYTEKSTQDHE